MLNPENKTYTILELLKLKNEYVETLSSTFDEWYTCPKDMASHEIEAFFGWLNIRNNTP